MKVDALVKENMNVDYAWTGLAIKERPKTRLYFRFSGYGSEFHHCDFMRLGVYISPRRESEPVELEIPYSKEIMRIIQKRRLLKPDLIHRIRAEVRDAQRDRCCM
jgi:hypothetical protein